MAVGGGSGGASGSIRAGRAHVEMSAKDAGLQKSLDGIQRKMLGVAKVAGAMLIAIASALGGQAVAGFKSAVQHMDKLNDSAQRLGTTTEALSALGYAAEQSGAGLEDMESAGKFLNKNLTDNADAFAEFGLNAEKLKSMSLDQQMLAVADAIGTLPTASERTAAAMQLLGRQGDKLMQLFTSGELRGLLGEAGKVGAIVKTEDAKNAARIADAFDRVWTAGKNTFRAVGSIFLGGADKIEVIADFAVLALARFREFNKIAGNFIESLLPKLNETWDAFANAVKAGDFDLALETVEAKLLETWQRFVLGMQRIWNGFKEFFVDTWHSILTEVRVAFVQFFNWYRDRIINNVPAELLDFAARNGGGPDIRNIQLPTNAQRLIGQAVATTTRIGAMVQGMMNQGRPGQAAFSTQGAFASAGLHSLAFGPVTSPLNKIEKHTGNMAEDLEDIRKHGGGMVAG